MAVLVIGGAGYIGSHMVLALQDIGERPIVLDNLSTGFRSAVPEGVPFVVGDFAVQSLVSALIDEYAIEAVIHFAAKIVVPESVNAPLTYYENNTCKARQLLDTVVQSGVKYFVFSSTAAVYGDPDQNPVVESTPQRPLSPYGRSKLMVEWMLRDVSQAHDLHHVILRYFNVAGADPLGRVGQSTANASHLIKVAIQCALGLRPGMEVFGTDYPTPDGSCVRDYIQVTDLVRAHIDALQYLRADGESLTCNCGYGQGFSVLDVIRIVKEVSGVDFQVSFAPRRAGDSASVVASNALIKSQLNWQPQHQDLRQIVRQALDWERRLHNRSSVN